MDKMNPTTNTAGQSGLAIKAFKEGLAAENQAATKLLETIPESVERPSENQSSGFQTGQMIDIIV